MRITHDPQAELALLAACLWSVPARKEARRHLSPSDFYDPAHEMIWSAMSTLDRDGHGVDPATVRPMLHDNSRALEALIEATTGTALPQHVGQYATTVRAWAVRRRIWNEAARAQQSAEDLEVDPHGLASAVATKFAAVRDSGAEDIVSITLGELLERPDEAEDWVVPDLLERRDRLMLTGAEGLGKSYLLRQIAVMAAGGLHPFDFQRHITPMRSLIIDCENSERQVRRKARGIVNFTKRWSEAGDPEAVSIVNCGRIDILRDKDLAMIHREVDTIQPDIIVIGPLYAMSPRALMTDDDAVPVLAALDSLRETGACLLMEAHAGHSVGTDGRNFRPRGSSSLLGWPEFGYGLKPESDSFARMVPWRGDRDERNWPQVIKHDTEGIRWVSVDAPLGDNLDRWGRPA